MDISDPTIIALRAKVIAAREEFDLAVTFHEAWKPAAYDGQLHTRMGPSYASNTFLTIRQALRREMLLALMRLWDNDKRLVSMISIYNILNDKRVIDALTADRVASPALTSSGTSLPLSSRAPGPTAMTSPSCGFSLAVSGMMMPPFVFSSPSMRRMTTRSCNGRNFMDFAPG